MKYFAALVCFGFFFLAGLCFYKSHEVKEYTGKVTQQTDAQGNVVRSYEYKRRSDWISNVGCVFIVAGIGAYGWFKELNSQSNG